MSHIDNSPGVGSNNSVVDLLDTDSNSLGLVSWEGNEGDVKLAVILLVELLLCCCECQPAADIANVGVDELQAIDNILKTFHEIIIRQQEGIVTSDSFYRQQTPIMT